MTDYTSNEKLLAELNDKLLEENTRFRMGMARVFKLAPHELLDVDIDTVINNALDMALDLDTANGVIELYQERVGDLEAATTMKIAYQRMLKQLQRNSTDAPQT